jgi:hypothetical protein
MSNIRVYYSLDRVFICYCSLVACLGGHRMKAETNLSDNRGLILEFYQPQHLETIF